MVSHFSQENKGANPPAAEIIAEATEADVVTCIGTKFVLYRRSKKKPKIELP